MKTKSYVLNVLDSKIKETRNYIESYSKMMDSESSFEYDNEMNFYNCIKNHFESIMKNQFKLVELIRMKNMIEYGIKEPFEMMQVICNRYTDELLSYPLMSSSTNVICNLASVWENEVKQQLLKFYKNLMK